MSYWSPPQLIEFIRTPRKICQTKTGVSDDIYKQFNVILYFVSFFSIWLPYFKILHAKAIKELSDGGIHYDGNSKANSK